MKNVREALEKLLVRQNRLLRARTLAAPPPTRPTVANESYEGCRLRLLPHLERSKGARQRRARLRLPSASQASWLLLREAEQLKDEDKKIVELLGRLSPEIARARELARDFVGIIKGRRADALRAWLIGALRSEVVEFISFANGVSSDLQAVKAALEYE